MRLAGPPRQLYLNCDGTRMAIIDAGAALSFADLEGSTGLQPASLHVTGRRVIQSHSCCSGAFVMMKRVLQM